MKKTRSQEAFLRRLVPAGQILRLFDLLPEVSFFVKDREGRFMAHSLTKFERFGIHDEEEVIGRTDHDFFPADRADAYRADDLAVMNSGEPIINRMEAAPENIGSPRLVATSKIPLRDKRGEIIGIAGFSRPVDQLREGGGLGDRFAKIINRLHDRFGESITTGELAAMAGLSVSQFERRFREAFGTSPRQYLLRIRVDAAARMLAATGRTVSEIALECGFHDHAHLSRSFRKIMQVTPTQYRRTHRLDGP
ncbi:MAG: AraC family transcriptional regulator [Akkermansiaceae bacterium]|nr:AraC family transcriptional regulator [Akkermansiaceae bacterium]NNM30710.1 AraC family transcriptional regulator [Akkermansiaceae bacterium]